MRNRPRFIGPLLTVAGLTCIALVSGGCAGLPLYNVRDEQPSRPNTSKVSEPAPAIANVQHTTAAARAVARPAAEIAQVGFRRSVHVGDSHRPPQTGETQDTPSQVGGCSFGPCANQSAGSGCVACSPAAASNPQPYGYAMPPMIPPPWLYDPQEFLCDGGDQDPYVALTHDDRIVGLNPEDTVSHYTTQDGDIEFTASNRVCVYSPRFGNVRRITGAIQGEGAIAVAGAIRPVGPQGINYDLPGLVLADSVELEKAKLTRRIDSMRDRNRGVRIESIDQPLLAANVLDVLAGIQNVSLSQLDESLLAMLQRHAVAANIWTLQETVEVEIQDLAPPVLVRDERVDALVVYEFPDAGRLNLIKLADKQHAAIGDTVTFALRLQNVGDSAVSGVVVTDNLTTRLEYVADSQTASIDADFETKLNSASSSQLIWRLKKELAVGESVTIEFQCRVR